MRWQVWMLVAALSAACRAAETPQAPANVVPASPPTAAPAVPAAAPASTAFVPYGAPLAALPGSERPLAALVAEPEKYVNAVVTVSGVVREVCQQRGCWLELAADTSPDAVGCRVVSQHHAFFVPRDSVGSQVRVQGKLEVHTVSAAQVQHMEAEGGHFAAKLPDGTAREVSIVASGVELARAASR